MTLTTAARAEDVVRRYGSGPATVTALGGASIEVLAGSFTAVMGPSGSGKSTLLHCMAGLDRPTSGRVWIGSEEIASMPDRRLTRPRRDRIGFVFQAFLLTVLSAAGNINLPLDIAGRKPDPDWLAAVVAAVGLTGRLAHRPAATRCATRAALSPLRKKAQCVPVSSSLSVWLRPRYSRSPC